MKSSVVPLVALLPSILATLIPSQLQFCHQDPEKKSDLCVALSSTTNTITSYSDVSLHLSARFEDGIGWAAFGIGAVMNGAFMFVFYPGNEAGDVTLSIRSTIEHHAPQAINETNQMKVVKTWVDGSGVHNVQLVCYSCDLLASSMPGGSGTALNVTSNVQPWIWALNSKQKIRSDKIDVGLKIHDDRGMVMLNMATSHSPSNKLSIAILADSRISVPAIGSSMPDPPSGPAPAHHKHSTFGLGSIHGLLLSTSFFALSIGVIAIRSGLSKSFVLHWRVQAVATGCLVIGWLIGVLMTISHGTGFGSLHKILGLSILPTMLGQATLGWWHHVNFKRLRTRTAVSNWHVWVGRGVMLLGNTNVWLGLKLSPNRPWVYYLLWYIGIGIQLALLLPTWYFWSKGQKLADVIPYLRNRNRKGENERRGAYARVEENMFLVGDDENGSETLELDEERSKEKNSSLRE